MCKMKPKSGKTKPKSGKRQMKGGTFTAEEMTEMTETAKTIVLAILTLIIAGASSLGWVIPHQGRGVAIGLNIFGFLIIILMWAYFFWPSTPDTWYSKEYDAR